MQAVGIHNQENAAAAIALVMAMHSEGRSIRDIANDGARKESSDARLSLDGLQAAIGSLQPPPHRMEAVGNFGNILWINDSKVILPD